MNERTRNARRRALRASAAVTLGGLLAGAPACGSEPTTDDDPDATLVDAGSDTATDDAGESDTPERDTAGVDTSEPDTSEPDTREPDATPGCLDESDNVCPEGCDENTDWDCCEEYDQEFFGGDWCNYDPDWGCGCAVEGPFAPPSLGVAP